MDYTTVFRLRANDHNIIEDKCPFRRNLKLCIVIYLSVLKVFDVSKGRLAPNSL